MQRRRHIAGDESCPYQAETTGIVVRHHKRLRTRIGSHAEGVRQFGQQCQNERAAAGAEVGDAQFSRARSAGIDRRERRLDDSFCFWSWHQRRGIDAQRQAPEFLVSENACARLAGEAAVRQRRNDIFLVCAKLARRGRSERRMIEAKGVAYKDTGIEVWGVQAGGLEFCRQRTPDLGSRARTVRPCNSGSIGVRRHQFTSSAASNAAWFSATSALMISPKA